MASHLNTRSGVVKSRANDRGWNCLVSGLSTKSLITSAGLLGNVPPRRPVLKRSLSIGNSRSPILGVPE